VTWRGASVPIAVGGGSARRWVTSRICNNLAGVNDVRWKKVCEAAFGVHGARVRDIWFEGTAVVLAVEPRARFRQRCPECGFRCPGYDQGSGPRLWRAMAFGTFDVLVQAPAPRVECKRHGVVVASVPWARHRSGFTRDFEDQVAWLTQFLPKSRVVEFFHIDWATVGAILHRVVQERLVVTRPLDGLRRIGIDEVSFRKGHKYLTVVYDHDTGRLVWAAEGRDSETLGRFFDELGPRRANALTHVSADAASWISSVVRKRAKQAVLCIDPFHVVAWANEALDEVRRGVWNAARREGSREEATSLKGMRYVVVKNPENLSESQARKLSVLERLNRPLYRAYLLKEALRQVFALKSLEGAKMLEGWRKWAQRSRLKPFVKLGRRIARHMDGIKATLEHRLTQGLTESNNKEVGLLNRIAHGFHSAAPLIALMFLKLGKLGIRLPSTPISTHCLP